MTDPTMGTYAALRREVVTVSLVALTVATLALAIWSLIEAHAAVSKANRFEKNLCNATNVDRALNRATIAHGPADTARLLVLLKFSKGQIDALRGAQQRIATREINARPFLNCHDAAQPVRPKKKGRPKPPSRK